MLRYVSLTIVFAGAIVGGIIGGGTCFFVFDVCSPIILGGFIGGVIGGAVYLQNRQRSEVIYEDLEDPTPKGRGNVLMFVTCGVLGAVSGFFTQLMLNLVVES